MPWSSAPSSCCWGVVDIPHGYWFAMTLTVVLRPYGAQTQSVARQRVLGASVGAALALWRVDQRRQQT